MIPLILPRDLPPPRTALSGILSKRHPFLLASAARDTEFGRFSFAGADPFLTLTTRGRQVTIAWEDGRTESFEDDPLLCVRRLLREYRLDETDQRTPLPSGAVGFLSYDLCRQIERIPDRTTDDLGLPDVFLAFYDTIATWDHRDGSGLIASSGLPEHGRAGRERAAARAEEFAESLAGASAPRTGLPRLVGPLRSTFTKSDYVDAVARAVDLIAAGDIFQVNLSQRFATTVEESGAAIFDRLTRSNPASFAAYMASSCGAEILSASPERLLRVSGRSVSTTPIKGTRPRSRDRDEDARLARELLTSEKDRAELVMIVDLLRSDLGRVAEFGSIDVPELFALSRHPTVHHLHGTVTARLAADRDRIDLLRSGFPGGSITGAPKVRAMEVIEEFEPVRRGVYTGSVGYLSFTGETDLNVAIRTMVVKEGRATFSVGGGIVADSDPVLEYEETIHKGRGLAAALGFSI